MKKLFILAVACVLAFTLNSCGGHGASKGDSPSDVVKKALTCVVNEDFNGMVQYIEGVDQASEEEVKEAAAWLSLLYGIGGGIKEFKIIGEEVAEDGQTATVTLNITDRSGNSHEDQGHVVRTDDGRWALTLK